MQSDTRVSKIFDKQALRKTMLKILKNQKEVSRLKKSERIRQKLFALSEFKNAKMIMFYASFAGEVYTYKMIKEAIKKGKKVSLPFIVMDKKRLVPRAIKNTRGSLEKGPFGIPQPRLDCSQIVSKKDLDLVIVPGLAFSRLGFRLGRGLGFYDRFLKDLSNKTCTVGACFNFQIVSSVPHSSKDLTVKKVISA